MEKMETIKIILMKSTQIGNIKNSQKVHLKDVTTFETKVHLKDVTRF